jgi:hypothetical protein
MVFAEKAAPDVFNEGQDMQPDNPTTLPETAAALRQQGPAADLAMVDEEGQQWLGCEGLHPLTWLPSADVRVVDARE